MIDTSDVRKMNMNAIRAVMWRGGEHTKQSIAADTGLSVATCNTLLNELERSGEVYSQKYQLNGVGRSTSVYQINEDYESILCVRIDLDSEGNRLLLCDVLSMLRSTLYQEQTQFTILDMDRVAGKITEMLEKFPNISCILVGTSGIHRPRAYCGSLTSRSWRRLTCWMRSGRGAAAADLHDLRLSIPCLWSLQDAVIPARR